MSVLIVDETNAQGVKRLNNQYWRINIDPSERYAFSLIVFLKGKYNFAYFKYPNIEQDELAVSTISAL